MNGKTGNFVFLSYVREDASQVDRLVQDLRKRGIEIWLDREQIQPGERWQEAIHNAIHTGLYFIACFSKNYSSRDKCFMNEELTTAIDQLRQYPSDRTWFIPVLLSECEVPNRIVGGGETLRSFQWVELFRDWDSGLRRIVSSISAASARSKKNRQASESGTSGFREWLATEKCPARPSKTVEGLFQIGGCTVLHAASSGQDFSELVLEQIESLASYSPEWGIDEVDLVGLERRVEELTQKKVRGTSMSLVQFIPGLSDDPPRLRYRVVDYKYARSFLSLQQESKGCLERYRSRTLRVLDDGYRSPNIVSTGLVVVVGTAESPELVLARRRERSAGFDEASWSVTIGEQFNPVTGPRGNRQSVERDFDIEESCFRGLKEELVGETALPQARISIHALVREDDRNNFIFVGLADLRPLSFGELAELWPRAEDAGEHTALISVPLSKKALNRCIESAEVPKELLSSSEMGNRVIVAAGSLSVCEGSSKWQPNSMVRLALARWLCDFEATERG